MILMFFGFTQKTRDILWNIFRYIVEQDMILSTVGFGFINGIPLETPTEQTRETIFSYRKQVIKTTVTKILTFD